jgi:Arc/MetJ-type ribon-helix-helix transcriptional regulator
MSEKQRVSASIDADVLQAARAAVAAGRAENLSAWVNAAMRRQLEHERGLQALGEAIAAYEAEHGEITQEEMEEAERNLRARAIVVRGRGQGAA